MNYELVYKARGHYQAVMNARIKVYDAEKALKTAELTAQQRIADLIGKGTDEFDFTTEMYMADGIHHHVFNKAYYHGVGHRKCYFCDCDDFDGF